MKPLRIGLTGGIASGKSTVSDLFAQKNIAVIDADKIAKALFKPNAPLLKDLKNRFGSNIFYPSGELNRVKLSDIVFNSKEELAWLNQLTHPQVTIQINRELEQITSEYVILDIPLLVDKNGNIPEHLRTLINRVLVISVSLEKQIERLCQRNQMNNVQAMKIISNQSTLEQKLNCADDIIDNNSDISALKEQVDQFHSKYLSLAKMEHQ